VISVLIMPLRRHLPKFDLGSLASSTRVLD